MKEVVARIEQVTHSQYLEVHPSKLYNERPSAHNQQYKQKLVSVSQHYHQKYALISYCDIVR